MKRIFWMDAFRAFAPYVIIFVHVFQYSPVADYGPEITIAAAICNAAVSCFLLISGALLLPVATATPKFYRKRFGKVVPALLLWSLIYVAEQWATGAVTAGGAVMKLLTVPLVPAEGVIWFLYIIIACYLFMPVLSIIIRHASLRLIEGLLAVWLISCSLPFLGYFVPSYLATKTVMFQFYSVLGMPLLGWWLMKHPERLRDARVRAFGIGVFVLLGIALPLFAYVHTTGEQARFDLLNTDFAANVNLYGVAMFLLFRGLFGRVEKAWMPIGAIVADASRYSMGIYLAQILVIRQVVLPLFPELCSSSPWVVILGGGLVAYLCTYLAVKAVSYLPGSRFLIGA